MIPTTNDQLSDSKELRPFYLFSSHSLHPTMTELIVVHYPQPTRRRYEKQVHVHLLEETDRTEIPK